MTSPKERAMTFYRFLLPVAAAAFLGVCSPAQPAPTAPPPPYCGAGYGNGVINFLTPEQRMMHFAEVQKATAEMSFNDARAYRWTFRDKVMAMSAAERRTFADDLAAKWNKLSAEEKTKVQQEFMTYRGSGRWGMGKGMGHRMGRGGCWW
jgi:hypothetical protein